VLDSWGIVEDTNVGVDHLVISDEKDGWHVDGFLGVLGWHSGRLGDLVEMLFNVVDNLVVVDITGGDDNDLVSDVIGSVEFS